MREEVSELVDDVEIAGIDGDALINKLLNVVDPIRLVFSLDELHQKGGEEDTWHGIRVRGGVNKLVKQRVDANLLKVGLLDRLEVERLLVELELEDQHLLVALKEEECVKHPLPQNLLHERGFGVVAFVVVLADIDGLRDPCKGAFGDVDLEVFPDLFDESHFLREEECRTGV